MTHEENQPDNTSNQPKIQPYEGDPKVIARGRRDADEWLQNKRDRNTIPNTAYTPDNGYQTPSPGKEIFEALRNTSQNINDVMRRLMELIPNYETTQDPMFTYRLLAVRHTAILLRTPPEGVTVSSQLYRDAIARLKNLLKEILN